jgi:hypothetical protein
MGRRQKDCHLLEIVKDHIDVIMKLIGKEVDITSDVTKCLDTALVATAVYLGKEAKHIRDQCDVNRIVALRKSILEKVKDSYRVDVRMVQMFLRDLFNPRSADKRCIYYIMINHCDGTAPPGVTPSTKMFTGHVFVIERKPDADFYVYQSYLDHYSLPQYYQMNSGSFRIEKETLRAFFIALQEFYKSGIWSAEWNAIWLKFAHADESALIGYNFLNKIHFCYRRLPTNTCTESLRTLLVSGKKSLPKYTEEFDIILKKIAPKSNRL